MKTVKWAELKAKMSPEAQARVAAGARELERELRLNEIRRARGLAQVSVAETLEITQSEVSRLERRTDLYISTLRRFIEAIDGQLVLLARFRDGEEIEIRLDEPAGTPLKDINATLKSLRRKGHQIGEPYVDGSKGRMYVVIDNKPLTAEEALSLDALDASPRSVDKRRRPAPRSTGATTRAARRNRRAHA